MADGPDTYMRRAIALAKRAEGYTSPNPMVGCVIVKDGAIVGEGWHAYPGGPHAEVEALAQAGAAARGATAYVTLEPCNHTGRTPPCTKALIASKIAEVVYAVADPNPAAAGGHATLEAAGIKTSGGFLAHEAEDMNRFWLTRVTKSRPHIVVKFAASLDGKIATRTGDSQWITGPGSRARAHDLRHAADAILVGVDTVLADDPALTARPKSLALGAAPAHPLRVVLDSTGRTPTTARLVSGDLPGDKLIVTTDKAPARFDEAMAAHGVEVLRLPADASGRVDLKALLTALADRDIVCLMVEGGANILGAFFDAKLVDEVWAFLAPVIIGGPKTAVAGAGPDALADALRLDIKELERLGDDIFIRGRPIAQQAALNLEEEATCLQAS
ncbi:MAG: bifunctional diaminohydroxyphosphoribosylaminopyrimidine deaminase/5-amino-6-(5-phosphoribosylamino)uracil reductase RibD [Pseudomonadota bacterium]